MPDVFGRPGPLDIYLAGRDRNQLMGQRAALAGAQVAEHGMGILAKIQAMGQQKQLQGILSSNIPIEEKQKALMSTPAGIPLAGALAQLQQHHAALEKTQREQRFNANVLPQYMTPGRAAIDSPSDDLGGGPPAPAVAPKFDYEGAIRAKVAAGLADPLAVMKELAAERKPSPLGAGGAIVPDGRGGYTVIGGGPKSPSVGTTRTIQMGDQSITQEYQTDGTWKQIGSGPKFARSVAPVINLGDGGRGANKPPIGYRFTKDGNLEAIPGGPADRGRGGGPRNAAMSATAQRELIQTDEEIQGGLQALSFVSQAKDINDKAMGFLGAGAVATAATLLPGSVRPSSIDATQNLKNIVQNTALPQLKAMFGGNPTEGERKILLEVQGSVDQPPEIRKKIFERAEQAIKNRMKLATDKAKALRDGTYFSSSASPDLQDQSQGYEQVPDTPPPGAVRRKR